MKPDADRLLKQSYPFFVTVPSRFGDLDPLGHINNVAIGSFYEEGRANLNRTILKDGGRTPGMRLLIADVHIAYLAEAHYPGDLEIGAGISRIGSASYTIAKALFQNDICVGTCESVLVNTDGTKPAPLPDEMRAALKGFMLKT